MKKRSNRSHAKKAAALNTFSAISYRSARMKKESKELKTEYLDKEAQNGDKA